MRILLASFVALLVGSSGACSPNPEEVRLLTVQEASLVQSSNVFGFKLFDQVVDQSQGEDVFISPLSVSMALGMTLNGANGETFDAMRATLEYKDLSQQEINQGYLGLRELLVNLDPDVALEIANSIWYRQGLEVLQDFIAVNVKFFDAVVQALDFSQSESADTINAWVREKTHDKIDGIVAKPIDPSLVMFLINAVYFKGSWTIRFDEKNTRDDEFLTGQGAQKPVKMMSLHAEDFLYLENDEFQAVDLPYGSGLFSMTIFLPKLEKNIDELIGRLGENWDGWMNGFTKQEGDLYLPRFELKYETSLNEVLKALGMEVAFLGSADFTRISADGGLYISNVRHKSYVKVNEEGTEAAAVTSVEIGEVSLPMTFTMTVDRPFVFVIHDRHSQALLFMGKIVDPVSE